MGFYLPDYRFVTPYNLAGLLLALTILALSIRPRWTGSLISSVCLASYVAAGAILAMFFDQSVAAKAILFNPVFSPAPVNPCERMFVYYQGMNYHPLLFLLCCAALLLLQARLHGRDKRPGEKVGRGAVVLLGAVAYAAIVLLREGIGFYTSSFSLYQWACFLPMCMVVVRQFECPRAFFLADVCLLLTALAAHLLFAVAWREQMLCLQQPTTLFPLGGSVEEVAHRLHICRALLRTGLVSAGGFAVMLMAVGLLCRRPRGDGLRRTMTLAFVFGFASAFHALTYWLFYVMSDCLTTHAVWPVLSIITASVLTVVLPLVADRLQVRGSVTRWMTIFSCGLVLVLLLTVALRRGSALAIAWDVCNLGSVVGITALVLLVRRGLRTWENQRPGGVACRDS